MQFARVRRRRSARFYRAFALSIRTLAYVLAIWVTTLATVRSDEFGRLEGASLFDLPKRADARQRTTLTTAALEALPTLFQGESGALVLIRTDQQNLTKMLVSAGLRKRKPSEKLGPLVPVLIVERFETIDPSDRLSIVARGKELMLFDGFQLDLDSGQVVPAEMGGDILFSTTPPEGPRLVAVGDNRMTTLQKPLQPDAVDVGRPSSGRAVKVTDYNGRFNLIANAQWTGTLDLSVNATGEVTGRFRSDLNGAVHSVAGKINADSPQKIEFEIQFPQARQSYEGLLWTVGKDAFAGTLSMLERPYSFVAIREGAKLRNADVALDIAGSPVDRRHQQIVRFDSADDRFEIDGKPCSQAELVGALAALVKVEPATSVLLRVSDAVSFERVRRVVKAIQANGIKAIRLAPEIADPPSE